MSKQNNHHVIILGCGRSGTSIFGELFEHLNPYTYHGEPYFEELLKFNFASPVAVKVPNESPGYAPTPGLSFPLDILLRKIPDPKKIYWQVRHPLDSICSLKAGISNNWGHHPKPPDWHDWLKRPLIERCAHHWNYINSRGFDQVKHVAKVTRFEEMIRNPKLFAESICADLGLNLSENESQLADWASRVQDTNNEHFIEAKISRDYSRPDHKFRVGRWKENLSATEIRNIIPIIENTATQFGYLLDQQYSD